LRDEAEFRSFKCVLLRHGAFGALEAVEDQLAEEGKSDFSRAGDVVLAFAVDEKQLIAAVVGGCDVDVFAKLDKALGAEDNCASVAP